MVTGAFCMHLTWCSAFIPSRETKYCFWIDNPVAEHCRKMLECLQPKSHPRVKRAYRGWWRPKKWAEKRDLDEEGEEAKERGRRRTGEDKKREANERECACVCKRQSVPLLSKNQDLQWTYKRLWGLIHSQTAMHGLPVLRSEETKLGVSASS